MAELNPPWALQNVATLQSVEARKLVESLVGTPGVIGPADLVVTQNATPDMSVLVAAGAAFVRGSTTPASQGTYHLFSDSTVNRAMAASNATNPRIDLVVARVQDSFYAGAVDAWDLFVVTGTPAATPVVPALPASSLALAEVLVGAGVTSVGSANITNRRVRADSLRSASPALPYKGGTGNIVTLTTTAQDVPGATLTFTPSADWVGLAVMTFDFFLANSGVISVGVLVVDGATSAQQALLSGTAGDRLTATAAVPVSLTAGVAHTIKLQALRASAGTGGQVTGATSGFGLLRA